jgi:hypothetical protein
MSFYRNVLKGSINNKYSNELGVLFESRPGPFLLNPSTKIESMVLQIRACTRRARARGTSQQEEESRKLCEYRYTERESRKRKQPHRKRKHPQVSRATSTHEKRDSTPEPYALIWWKVECRLWCMPPSWEELGVLLTDHVGSLTKSGYCSYFVVTF